MSCLYVVDYSLALDQESLLFNHCFPHLPQDAHGLAGCTTHYHPAAALKTHFSRETQLASWPAKAALGMEIPNVDVRGKLKWNPAGIMRVNLCSNVHTHLILIISRLELKSAGEKLLIATNRKDDIVFNFLLFFLKILCSGARVYSSALDLLLDSGSICGIMCC